MTNAFEDLRVEDAPTATILTLTFKERLTTEDYAAFVPLIEDRIERGSPVRLLVELKDFKGWTAGAMWEDTKFAARHFEKVERLAVVGESHWEEGAVAFVKPFSAAEMRYFDTGAADRARRWIRSPST